MAESSDEDNSSEEEIDLEALRRDKIYLETDDEETKKTKSLETVDDIECDEGIALYLTAPSTSFVPQTEQLSPLETMQKLLDYYNNTPTSELMPIPIIRNSTPPECRLNTRMRPITGGRVFSRISEGSDDVVQGLLSNGYRPSPNLIRRRRLPPEFSTSPPRWATIASSSPLATSTPPRGTTEEEKNEDEEDDEFHPHRRFLLPSAIRVREMAAAPKVDKTKQADKAVFVSDLILSTIVKRN